MQLKLILNYISLGTFINHMNNIHSEYNFKIPPLTYKIYQYICSLCDKVIPMFK